jgi:hypothetical protein
VLLPFALITDHALSVFAIGMGVAFLFGVYGHIIHSRTMIITAILLIAAISLFFVIAGEAQTHGIGGIPAP